ncbi:hypothetical protein ACP275_09G068700 [Erythranthe tilingii]
MMPDLPNVGSRETWKVLRSSLRALALVIRGTGLYELWKTGRYRNYPPEQLVDIVARILSLVPPWTRMPLVTSCVEKGNLRDLALARMDDLGLKCRDVRTRELSWYSGHPPQYKTRTSSACSPRLHCK